MLEKYQVMEEPTDKQKAKIVELEAKKIKTTVLTENQQLELDTYTSYRDNPLDHITLSKGAKTVLRKMRREIKFKRRKELKSKYLKKGIELEEKAITFLSKHHNDVFTNNTERRFSEFFSGESDVEEGYDTKVAYELDTLPDVEESLKTIYEYQDRVYMILWDKEQWTTSTIIMNMLDDQMVKEIYGEVWKWQPEDIPDWRKIEIIKHYIYDEENFIRLCKFNDCMPDLAEYARQLESGDVDELLEKACDMFQDFVEIPDHERIVEKTVYRDKDIEAAMNKIAELSRKYMQDIENEMFEIYESKL